jgi:NAD+ diphosphatase
MLILHGNSLLLGRSAAWPEGMYSLLAGFMEPGESIEAAVRREVFEETGVVVGQVDYLASQPWPFPSSLMIGCVGEASTREITLDPAELEDARWLSREQTLDALAGLDPSIRPARPGSIARFLIERWLADRLT